MADTPNDANTGASTEVSSGVADSAGSSPDTEHYTPKIDDDGLISTVEFERDEPASEASSTPDTSGDAEQNTSKGSSDKQDFNDHPRFKELIEQKNTHKSDADRFKKEAETARKELEEFRANQSQPQTKADKAAYENVFAWDNDTIINNFMSDPKAFLKTYGQQLWHEFQDQHERVSASQRQQNAQAQQRAVQEKALQRQTEFFSSNDEAKAMLNDGRIKAFIERNPGRDPISAFKELTGASVYQAKVDAAVKAAVKEAEEKVYKQLKAKGYAGSNASTAGHTLNEADDPELKNPEKFGGAKAVAVARYLRRAAGKG